jgi:hypothetical protein
LAVHIIGQNAVQPVDQNIPLDPCPDVLFSVAHLLPQIEMKTRLCLAQSDENSAAK